MCQLTIINTYVYSLRSLTLPQNNRKFRLLGGIEGKETEMNTFVKSLTCILKPVPLAKQISTSYRNYKDDFENLIHPEGHEPNIPLYVERNEESKEVKKARLLYQSRKRGMLENGLLLSTFAKKYLSDFDDKQLHLYDRLINLPTNDWDIFYWATGTKPTPSEFDNEIMDLLKKHIKNEDRQARIMQPEL